MHVVLLVGPTGSGRSTALEALRELGFAGVDSSSPRPVRQLLARTLPERVAIVIDADEDAALDALPSDIQRARQLGWTVDLLHLDATKATLMRRAVAAGKQPPLADYGMSDLGWDMERERLAPLKGLARVSLDTTGLTPDELRDRVQLAMRPPALEG